jgi:hypothetical protein
MFGATPCSRTWAGDERTSGVRALAAARFRAAGRIATLSMIARWRAGKLQACSRGGSSGSDRLLREPLLLLDEPVAA